MRQNYVRNGFEGRSSVAHSRKKRICICVVGSEPSECFLVLDTELRL